MLYFLTPRFEHTDEYLEWKGKYNGVFKVKKKKWKYITDMLEIFDIPGSAVMFGLKDRYVSPSSFRDFHKNCKEISGEEYNIMKHYFKDFIYITEAKRLTENTSKYEFRYDVDNYNGKYRHLKIKEILAITENYSEIDERFRKFYEIDY